MATLNFSPGAATLPDHLIRLSDLSGIDGTKFARIHRPTGAYTTTASDLGGVIVADGDVTLHFATVDDILKSINIKNLSGGSVTVLFAAGVSSSGGSATIDDGAALTAIVETADGGAVTYLLI